MWWQEKLSSFCPDPCDYFCVQNPALKREWRVNHNLWAAQTSRALPHVGSSERWILWNEAACCSPLPAVEGFPSIVLFWDINKEAEGVEFKQRVLHLWAGAAWDVCAPPAMGVLLKTDLKIYRAHIQPVCYWCEMRAILPLPHFIEALTISSDIGTIQHLCLCQRSLIMGFLGYWFLFFQTRECHWYFIWKLMLQKITP